jgi:hypothetical protein
MIEISIKVSDEHGEESLTCRHQRVHDGLVLSREDGELKGMVEDAIAKFKGTVYDVLIRIKYTW